MALTKWLGGDTEFNVPRSKETVATGAKADPATDPGKEANQFDLFSPPLTPVAEALLKYGSMRGLLTINAAAGIGKIYQGGQREEII